MAASIGSRLAARTVGQTSRYQAGAEWPVFPPAPKPGRIPALALLELKAQETHWCFSAVLIVNCCKLNWSLGEEGSAKF